MSAVLSPCRFRWLGLEPYFVPVLDDRSHEHADLVEASRLTSSAFRAVARGEDFPVDVQRCLTPDETPGVRLQLAQLVPDPFVASMCADAPAVSVSVARAKHAEWGARLGTAHPSERSYTWFDLEARFIPSIDLGDEQPDAIAYEEAEALTATARLCVERGLPLPPHVTQWIEADELSDVLAQLKAVMR